ncbi:hypothetical protein MTO96_049554 [Rhipicephalus appendiculatus]
MKVLLLCLFLFLREASCGVVEAPAYSTALVPETGTFFAVHGNYQFGYDEKHTSGGSFRHETGDAYGNKYGSYGLTDADGRVRIVKYVADANGFRVIVNTNEPGTAPSTPAAASINVPQEPVVPAPVATVAAAPVATVVAAPAPVVKTIVPAAPVVTAAAAPAVVAAPPSSSDRWSCSCSCRTPRSRYRSNGSSDRNDHQEVCADFDLPRPCRRRPGIAARPRCASWSRVRIPPCGSNSSDCGRYRTGSVVLDRVRAVAAVRRLDTPRRLSGK